MFPMLPENTRKPLAVLNIPFKINPSEANLSILHPLKNKKTRDLLFRGYQMTTLARNGLRMHDLILEVPFLQTV